MLLTREEFSEKDLSAKQSQTEKDTRFFGENERPGRPKRLEAKENEGEKAFDCLSPRFLKAVVKGPFRFTRRERITDPQDFRRVMKSGKRLPSKNFILFFQKNQNQFHRLGIVVKKEVGPATYRNRAKRYLREFFRLHKHQIEGSFDLIIMVKRGCRISRYREAEEELKGLFAL